MRARLAGGAIESAVSFARLVGLVAVFAGCGPPTPVRFAVPTAPIPAADYTKVHDRWTRQIHITRGFDTVMDAHVTLFSDEFRAALLAQVADTRSLPAAERQDRIHQEVGDAEKYIDFLVELDTSRYEWNDLSSLYSVWTVTLVDDRGHELGRPAVHIAPEKPDAIATLFPPVTPFTRTWRIRFPRRLADGTPVMDASTRWIALRVAGPLGRDEARWESTR